MYGCLLDAQPQQGLSSEAEVRFRAPALLEQATQK